MNRDEMLRLACETAGLDPQDNPAGGVWSIRVEQENGGMWYMYALHPALPAYVASLLVSQLKVGPSAVEYALHMARMDGCWANEWQRIAAALVALEKATFEEVAEALGETA